MHAARNYTNPDLTPEGLDKERERLAERARSTYAKEVDGHRSSLYLDRDRSAFDKYRPKLDWNKPADVAKAQSKWTAVQGKLDAGLSIGQIIETADATTLVAINEFYPDHAETVAARSTDRAASSTKPLTCRTFIVPSTTALPRSVGPPLQTLCKTARDAAGLHAHADVMLKYAEQETQGINHGMDPIYVAVSAQQAEAKAMYGGAGL